jgi:hypothetical protein
MACVILGGSITTAAASVPDPAENLAVGQLPSSCYGLPTEAAPTSRECENAVIYYLDNGRARMGLGPYDLPQDFPSLSPDRQMFILANLDRTAYSLPPVLGLNSRLDTSAQEGMRTDTDPAAVTEPPWIPFEYGADWAGSFPNALYGYFIWLYSDKGADISWGHRHVVLYEASALSMGAAVGIDVNGRAASALLVEGSSEAEKTSYDYTWQEALADGAGSNPYNPGTPHLSFQVGIAFAGSGSGNIAGSLSCQSACSHQVAAGMTLSLSAVPAANSTFAGWSGACSGSGACDLTIASNQEVTATFLLRPPTAANHGPGVRLRHTRISSRSRTA